jgi:hypothetical protein
MCSAPSLRYGEARHHPTGARRFTRHGWVRRLPERHERAVKPHCAQVVALLVLPTLLFLSGGAMAQIERPSAPLLSTTLRDGTPAEKQAIEQLGRPPTAKSLFDGAGLLAIEAIGAGSDITPFLAAGVPPDLTQAALRRAWRADPAIRDFVGLSENSGDSETPGGASGFGTLTTEDGRPLLARVIGDTRGLDAERPVAGRSERDPAPAPAGATFLPAPGSVPGK